MSGIFHEPYFASTHSDSDGDDHKQAYLLGTGDTMMP